MLLVRLDVMTVELNNIVGIKDATYILCCLQKVKLAVGFCKQVGDGVISVTASIAPKL